MEGTTFLMIGAGAAAVIFWVVSVVRSTTPTTCTTTPATATATPTTPADPSGPPQMRPGEDPMSYQLRFQSWRLGQATIYLVAGQTAESAATTWAQGAQSWQRATGASTLAPAPAPIPVPTPPAPAPQPTGGGPQPQPPQPQPHARGGRRRGRQGNNPYLININTANTQEFSALLGIDPQMANAIVALRQQNGYFQDIDDLLQVLDPATLAQIRPHITV